MRITDRGPPPSLGAGTFEWTFDHGDPCRVRDRLEPNICRGPYAPAAEYIAPLAPGAPAPQLALARAPCSKLASASSIIVRRSLSVIAVRSRCANPSPEYARASSASRMVSA